MGKMPMALNETVSLRGYELIKFRGLPNIIMEDKQIVSMFNICAHVLSQLYSVLKIRDST
jgi:hypothetical protein